MERLVDECGRTAFQVMDTSLTGTHIGNGYEPVILPILATGIVAKRQCDEKSIFTLVRAHIFSDRDVTLRLRDGHVSRA
jgi:hypothetical protein